MSVSLWCEPCRRGEHGPARCAALRAIDLLARGVISPPLLPGEGSCECPCDTVERDPESPTPPAQ